MSQKKVVVAGGGVLGSQIGLLSAYHGFEVTFWLREEGSIDRTQPKLERYGKEICKALEAMKEFVGEPADKVRYPQGLISDWDSITVEKLDELIKMAKERFENHIELELDMAKALQGAYLVIEAVSENPKVKQDFYGKAKGLLEEDTILCTNTSTLLPSTFAECTGRPEKYCALHFANSIWRNNTAEVMGHAGTDPAIFDEVAQFAEEIGMIALRLNKEQPGYLLNSLLVPLLEAAQALWANEVSDPKTIDIAWRKGNGAPLGPFQILDVVGLDTAYQINQNHEDAEEEGSLHYKIGQLLKEKIDKGEKGISAGKGFYDYE